MNQVKLSFRAIIPEFWFKNYNYKIKIVGDKYNRFLSYRLGVRGFPTHGFSKRKLRKVAGEAVETPEHREEVLVIGVQLGHHRHQWFLELFWWLISWEKLLNKKKVIIGQWQQNSERGVSPTLVKGGSASSFTWTSGCCLSTYLGREGVSYYRLLQILLIAAVINQHLWHNEYGRRSHATVIVTTTTALNNNYNDTNNNIRYINNC